MRARTKKGFVSVCTEIPEQMYYSIRYHIIADNGTLRDFIAEAIDKHASRVISEETRKLAASCTQKAGA